MDVYHTLLVAVTQLFLGSYVMLLIDFRKPVRLWRARWLATVTLVVCANLAGLLFLNFWNTYQRIGVLTVTLPYILTTLWCSAYRDFRAVFNLATALFVGSVGAVNSLLAHLFLGDDPYRGPWSLVVRAISFLLMFFLLRRFSFTYRQMLHQLNHRWGILCIIPLATFLAVIYTINRLDVTPAVMVLLYALLAVCACSYYLMYLFFERVQQETDARYESRLASMQLSALQSRMEAVKAAENAVRTERHDLRHRLQAVAQLVARGEQVEALDFLDAAQTRLEEHKVTRWCRPPVLDAVFASCFEQAKSQSIRVEASISLPDELPVDERELAIVVANALDNAIHANLELPVSRRCVRCRAVSMPGVMLEISNPCAGDVTFDSSGLPLARREGHGLGVQSISAFCRKNGAVCRFDLTDGWFRLQLVL